MNFEGIQFNPNNRLRFKEVLSFPLWRHLIWFSIFNSFLFLYFLRLFNRIWGKMGKQTHGLYLLSIYLSVLIFPNAYKRNKKREHTISDHYSVPIYPNSRRRELRVCMCMNFQWKKRKNLNVIAFSTHLNCSKILIIHILKMWNNM